MRCLSLFIYNDENKYKNVRNEIVNFLKMHRNEFLDIELETEIGNMYIDDYIQYIENDGKWGGELEKYAAQIVYGINIADYIAVKNSTGNIIYHNFVYFLNQDNNINKHLCLISNIDRCHFNLLYDKTYKVFKNNENKLIFLNNRILYNSNITIKDKHDIIIEEKDIKNKICHNNKLNKPIINDKEKIILINYNNKDKLTEDLGKKINNKINVLDNISEKHSEDFNESSESTISQENEVYYDNNNLFKIAYDEALIDLRKLSINKILKLYKKNSKKTNYADIYQYINSKNLNENKPLWPSSFKDIKNKNRLKNKKSAFRKACKNFF